jgi:hypothetical protein
MMFAHDKLNLFSLNTCRKSIMTRTTSIAEIASLPMP